MRGDDFISSNGAQSANPEQMKLNKSCINHYQFNRALEECTEEIFIAENDIVCWRGCLMSCKVNISYLRACCTVVSALVYSGYKRIN